jgi:hypothetical protein
MNAVESQNRPPLTLIALVAGATPFLLLGFELILRELPREWGLPAWIEQLRFIVFLLGIVTPSIGFAIGWVKSFPRWTYPYVGLMIFMSLYMQHVATPGLSFAGYELFGRELWGWRAWAPPVAALAAGLLASRSFHPLSELVRGVWEDWTKLTYALFGGMPLFIAALFDEMDRLYSLPFMVLLTLLMTATSLFYLQSTHPRRRLLALLLGITSILSIGFVATEVYWSAEYGANVPRMLLLLGLFTSILFVPAVIVLLRRSLSTPPARNVTD